jgi:YidC/Oxa1 family membrane protein insertase
MNDIRRSILWVVFGFSMVLIWDKWQIHNGKAPTFFPSSASVSAPADQKAATPASDASVPSATTAAAAPAAGASAPDAGAPAPVAVRHEVTTDVFKLSFNSEGGSLIGATLLQHASKQLGSEPFQLLAQNDQHTYIAQTGLIGGGFPTHKTPMTLVPGPTSLADGQDALAVKFESADVGGVKLVKTYTLKRGSYTIDVSHEVLNTGAAAVTPQLYVQLVRDGNKTDSETPFYSTFTGPAVYTGTQKYQKIEFGEITDNKATFEKNASDGYVAMVQHYFTSAWLLPEGTARENFARRIDNNLFSVGAISTKPAIAPGQSQKLEARLFVGPQLERCWRPRRRAWNWSRTTAG